MQPQLVAWVRARPLWLQATVAVLAALAAVYYLPPFLLREAGLGDAESRLKAENDLRTTLVQAAGGAIVLLATWRTLHINREGQITERFTRAIDQLGQSGKDKLDVRLGGIYALERIARDSESDRAAIIEVLTAFLREHGRWNTEHTSSSSVTPGAASGVEDGEPPRLRADLQAVATVLGRNHWSKDIAFDLPEVDLRRARLDHAHLQNADLSYAHLEQASLLGAHLEGSDLSDAHLEEAHLGSAHLEEADLFDAHLQKAFFAYAHLERAQLGGAHLEGATFFRAHLQGAFLFDAHLEEAHFLEADLQAADLTGANLEGADLTGANLEGADLSHAHLQGARLGGAQLEGAILGGAHMEGVEGLTPAQVKRVIGLSDAIGVPPGLLQT